MDVHKVSAVLSRIEVVESGRRRRWTSAEKLRIVDESFAGPRLVPATARRYPQFLRLYDAGDKRGSWSRQVLRPVKRPKINRGSRTRYHGRFRESDLFRRVLEIALSGCIQRPTCAHQRDQGQGSLLSIRCADGPSATIALQSWMGAPIPLFGSAPGQLPES